MMDVPASNVTNNDLYVFIDKWLNTKYQYGSQQNTGIDCSGFTQLLYDAVYRKKLARTSQSQYSNSTHINSRKSLQEGDLVFFTTVAGKKISHVGRQMPKQLVVFTNGIVFCGSHYQGDVSFFICYCRFILILAIQWLIHLFILIEAYSPVPT